MVFNGALCRIIRGQFADNYMFISILGGFLWSLYQAMQNIQMTIKYPNKSYIVNL